VEFAAKLVTDKKKEWYFRLVPSKLRGGAAAQ